MCKPSISEGVQLDYQLEAIEAALTQIIDHCTAVRPKHTPQILPTIHRNAKSIVLRGTHAHNINENLQPIIFTPFFPGSYTQPDVVVHSKNNDINEKNVWTSPLCNFGRRRLAAQDTPGISPLDPTLHFARFDPLNNHLNKIFNNRDMGIVVILSDSEKLSTQLDEQLVDQLEKNHGLDVDNTHMFLVSMVKRERNKKQLAQQNAGRLQVLQSVLKPLALSVHSISIENTESLMALLCKSRLALVPSMAVAMDALNASCSFQLYGCENNSSNEIVDLTALHAQHALTIKAQRKVQRRKLIVQQTEKQPRGLLIADINEMSSVFNYWISGSDNGDAALLTPAFQLTNSRAIIPVNSSCASDIRARWASSRAKVRKLYQSPRQFMQDSRYTGLRLLGRMAR